jgi:hypothetical protein
MGFFPILFKLASRQILQRDITYELWQKNLTTYQEEKSKTNPCEKLFGNKIPADNDS